MAAETSKVTRQRNISRTKSYHMTSVAFLGLGVMGGGMAGRLLSAGFPVSVWNRSPDRAEPLRERGAIVAGSPLDAAIGADALIIMVVDYWTARSVWLGVYC